MSDKVEKTIILAIRVWIISAGIGIIFDLMQLYTRITGK